MSIRPILVMGLMILHGLNFGAAQAQLIIENQTFVDQDASYCDSVAIISPSDPGKPVTITGNSSVFYRAGQTISLKAGFSVNGLTQNGNFNSKVQSVCYTQLEEADCGAIGLSLNDIVQADPVPGATQYEFFLENEALGIQTTYISNDHQLPLGQVPGLVSQTSYVVAVRFYEGNYFSDLGPRCQITIDPNLTVSPCGTDEVLDSILEEEPFLRDLMEADKQRIRDYIANNPMGKGSGGGQSRGIGSCTQAYTVPVVVHVIYDPAKPSGDISNTEITDQIARLNAEFNGPNPQSLTGENMCIQFCLAQTLPDGTANWNTVTNSVNNHQPMAGVTRASDASASYHNSPFPIAFPIESYLNIWVIENIPWAAGYVTLPLGMGNDGIVIRNSHFGANNMTLVHEAGHYLGLLHPFGITGSPGCPANNCPADENGFYDDICDTPPVEFPNFYCHSNANSCTNDWPSDGPDQVQNYMDYSGDACRTTFTAGQRDYMFATINTVPVRAELTSMANLIRTGVAGTGGCTAIGLTAEFEVDITQLCVGRSVLITGVPIQQTTTYRYTGTNGVEIFDSGNLTSPSYTASFPTASYAGTWSITSTVTDNSFAPPVVSTTKTQIIYVTDCQPITSEHGIWHFGGMSVLDFSTGAAVQVHPSANNSFYGVASIADPVTGDLLFYVNINAIYDRNHQPVTTALPGGQMAQAVVIVPDPGNAERYYIFHIDQFLSYSIVEISGGIPSIVTLNAIPLGPYSGKAVTGGLTAVPHCNGSDYWIIVHSAIPGVKNHLLAYQLTATGILPNPVVSNSAPMPSLIPQAFNNRIMEVSRDGRRVAISSFLRSDLFDFDKEAGTFTHITDLVTAAYGLSFSPSGDFLYAHQFGNSPSFPYVLTQFDLRNLNACNGNVSFSSVPLPYFISNVAAMQSGPDDKIYISGKNIKNLNRSETLSILNYPDVPNTTSQPNAMGLNQLVLTLDPGTILFQSLPNVVDAIPGVPPVDFEWCILKCEEVHFTNLGCGTDVSWDFGDGFILTGIATDNVPAGTHGGATSGTYQHPTHVYASPGSYTVTLTVEGVSYTQTVDIKLPPVPQIFVDRPECSNHEFVNYFTDVPHLDHDWVLTGNGSINGPNDQPSVSVTWSGAGSVSVTVTDPENGCRNTNMINVSVNTAPIADAGPDINTNTCAPPVQLNATGGSSCVWIPVNGLNAPSICDPIMDNTVSGSYTYTVVVTDANGCTDSDDITIDVVDAGNPWPIHPTGNVTSTAASFNDIAKDDQGFTYLTGYYVGQAIFDNTTLNNAGAHEAFIAKYDACNVLEWVNGVAGGESFSNGVAVDPSGNVFITGNFTGTIDFGGGYILTSTGGQDIFIARYNAAGVIQEAVKGGGEIRDMALDIDVDMFGDLYITGQTGRISTDAVFGGVNIDGDASGEFFVARYNANNLGQAYWVKNAGGSHESTGTALEISSAGDVYLTGTFRSTTVDFGSGIILNKAGIGNMFVVKYNQTGIPIWAQTGGGNKNEIGWDIAVDGNGDAYVTGSFQSSPANFGSLSLSIGNINNEMETFLVKYEDGTNGTALWARQAGSFGANLFTGPTWFDGPYLYTGTHRSSITIDQTGSSFVSGTFSYSAEFGPLGTINSTGGIGSHELFVLKYDPNGSEQWVVSAGTGHNYAAHNPWVDGLNGIAVDQHGYVYIAGLFGPGMNMSLTLGNATLSPPTYMFAARIWDNGNSGEFRKQAVANGNSSEKEPNLTADRIPDVSVHPNPTQGLLNLSIPTDQEISVQILNVLGQVWYQGAFENQVNRIDISPVPDGIYFLKVTQGNNTKTFKIVKSR